MRKVLNWLVGIIFCFLGVVIFLSILFSEANIFKHLLNLIKGPKLDYGWYEYIYNGTIVIINGLFVLLSVFLFKNGTKRFKTKT